MAQSAIPPEIETAGVGDWYQSINDMDKVKVRRYLQGIDTSSKEAFMTDLMERSSADHNYKLSTTVGKYAEGMDLDDYGRFKVSEAFIEGLFGAEMYDEAKKVCCSNLDLFPAIRDRLMADNGGELPNKISCRNRLIDITIGVECQYDMADEILSGYVDLGLIDEEEKAYRLQSIKIHRMQKTFDNLYNYRPKE